MQTTVARVDVGALTGSITRLTTDRLAELYNVHFGDNEEFGELQKSSFLSDAFRIFMPLEQEVASAIEQELDTQGVAVLGGGNDGR